MPIIGTTITRVSRMILSYLDRATFLPTTITDILNGTGTNALMLKRSPVLSVAQLIVSNQLIPQGQPNQATPLAWAVGPWTAGWYLEPWDGIPPGRGQLLSLAGGAYFPAVANVTVTYTYGYVVYGETQTVPDDTIYQVVPNQIYGIVAQDNGVTYADGTALTSVASNPSVGQYVPPNPFASTKPTNYYQFAAADANATMLLSYAYIPHEVEGACCEYVAERLSYRTRIGQRSKSVGGAETTSYQITDLPNWVKTALNPYNRVAPL